MAVIARNAQEFVISFLQKKLSSKELGAVSRRWTHVDSNQTCVVGEVDYAVVKVVTGHLPLNGQLMEQVEHCEGACSTRTDRSRREPRHT